jgi:hypothetical protein
VYPLGLIEPRFPSLAVEKEFVQVAGRADAVSRPSIRRSSTLSLAAPAI